MEIFIRILARLFVRKAYYKIKDKQNAFANTLALLEMRLPQLEAGVFKPDDSYILASSLQNRFEVYPQNNAKISQRLNALSYRLEGVKQTSLAKLDANAQAPVLAESERLSYLPELQIASEEIQGDVIKKQASTNNMRRLLGGLLILGAFLTCGGLFSVFPSSDKTLINKTASEDLSGSIALAAVCLPLLLLIPGLAFFARGSFNQSQLDANAKQQQKIKDQIGSLERIYGTDKSRYRQIYQENSQALDYLLQKTQNQDLHRLFQ